MRIFILDDEIFKHRNTIVKALNGHDLTISTNPFHAMRAYRGGYDLALLDHDMEGFYETRVSYKNTGFAFVEWLIDGHHKLPKEAIVHSQNEWGAGRMAKALKDVGVKAYEFPYGQNYINALKGFHV